METQPLNFSNAEPERIIKHRVSGYPEIVYDFTYCDERYRMLANSIFSVSSGIDGNILTQFINTKWYSVELSPQEMIPLYEDTTVLCSLGLFEGVGFLIDHETSTVSYVPPASLPSFKAFFYGDSDYSDDTMNQRFELTGLVNSDGTLSDSSRIVEGNLLQSDFKLGEPVAYDGGHASFYDAATLYYNGRLIKNDIMNYKLLVNGICLKDYDGDYSFLSYCPPKSVSLQPIDGQYSDSVAFVHERCLYFYAGSSLLKMDFTSLSKIGTGVYRADFGNFTPLEFTIGVPGFVSFHVSGYVLTDKNGDEIPWEGKQLNHSEIVSLGLDSDMADPMSNPQLSMPTPILLDEPSTDTAVEELQGNNSKAVSINEMLEHSNNELYGDNTVFRTEFIDKLYKILTDRSIVL